MIGIFVNLPDDLIKLVKKFIPPHPTAKLIKKEISGWNDATEDWTAEEWIYGLKHWGRTAYFSNYCFNSYLGSKKLKKVKEFIYNNNFRINVDSAQRKRLSTEQIIKLNYNWKLKNKKVKK